MFKCHLAAELSRTLAYSMAIRIKLKAHGLISQTGLTPQRKQYCTSGRAAVLTCIGISLFCSHRRMAAQPSWWKAQHQVRQNKTSVGCNTGSQTIQEAQISHLQADLRADCSEIHNSLRFLVTLHRAPMHTALPRAHRQLLPHS